MKLYLDILRVNLINTFQRDTAYFGNNWASMASTFLFIVTQIAFIQFLFGNITTIGSFTKNDVYFLMLVTQFSFFSQAMISFQGATSLADNVNNGELDYVLLKPIPQKWHIYTRSISLILTLFDAIPSILPIVIIINWSQIEVEPIHLAAGVLIFIMGFVIDHIMIYMLAITSFWTGSSGFTLNYFWVERTELKMPFENLFGWFKILIFIALPAFIASALTASVMLGYSSAAFWLPITFAAMIAWILFGRYLWSRALRQYSSASS